MIGDIWANFKKILFVKTAVDIILATFANSWATF